MQQYSFKSQQDVQQAANNIIQKILSDKSYTNPQKLSLLISQYQKKQQKLDIQLSNAIKTQIQGISQSKQTINEANNWMKQANQKTQNIKNLWSNQIKFHQFLQNVFTLNIFTTNLSKVIEQLTYFVDMQSQLQKLQKLSEDQSKYLYINSKLLNLIELRNAMLQDVSWQRENTIMRKQFVKVDNLQISFYDKIFTKFNDLLKFAKQDQGSVINSVKVIQAYDKALQAKGKPRVMRDRALQMIKQSVDQKFIQHLSNQDQLIGVIQNAKFAMTDLIQIGDYVQPCFPRQFPIMEIFQIQYKQNIQKMIIPYFDQIQEESQYGNLVVLLGWIDDYQTMLGRAGLDSNNLLSLKMKVKIMMPFFIDHNRKLVEDYIANCLTEDQKNYNRKFYEQTIMQGSDLVSFFPSDIFRFINQEAQIMQDKLKGEIFVQFVRCITEQLNMFQKNLAHTIMQQLQTIKMLDNDQKVVDFQYKLILMINNYNECLKHAGQSKQIFAKLVTEDYKNRIQKIFMNEVQKQFNYSIPMFIHGVLQIIFMKVIQQTYPYLFTQKWLSDNSRQLMTNIKNTITVQLGDIQNQSLIINIIHYRKLVQQTLQYLVNSYVEQLILFIRVIYKLDSPMEVKMVSQTYTRQKLINQDCQKMKEVFNSKVAFSEAVKKDKHVFLKFIESFADSTSKGFVTKLTNKFIVLSDLFLKKKGEFQQLLNKIAQLFPQKASELVEVVFIVRDDVQSRAATIPKRGMGIGINDY